MSIRNPSLFDPLGPPAPAPTHAPDPGLLRALWDAAAAAGGHGIGWDELLVNARGNWFAVQRAVIHLVCAGRLVTKVRERPDGERALVLLAVRPKEDPCTS